MTVTMPPRGPEVEPDWDLERRVADLEALIEEARQRARRRRLRYAGAVLIAAAVGVSIFVFWGRSAAGSLNASSVGPRSAAAPSVSPAAAMAGYVSAFVFDPRAPDTVYAATSADGLDHGGRVYKTTDAGVHWDATTPDWTRVDTLAADPQHPDTLYAGTGLGIYKTSDGGQSWEQSRSGLFTGPPNIGPAPADRRRFGWVTALAVDPRNGKHVFAVTTTGIRVSRDGGTNWKTVLRPGAYVDGATFAITRTRPEIDYVAVSMVGPAGCGVNARRHCAATSRLYTSTDGGTSWRSSLLPVSDGPSIILAPDPLQPRAIYLGHVRHLLASTDAGSSWRSIAGGTPNRDVAALVADPRRPATMYLVEGLDSDILKTTDGGRHWTQLGRLGYQFLAFALDPARPATIYAAVDKDHRSQILKSTDAGHTWAVPR